MYEFRQGRCRPSPPGEVVPAPETAGQKLRESVVTVEQFLAARVSPQTACEGPIGDVGKCWGEVRRDGEIVAVPTNEVTNGHW